MPSLSLCCAIVGEGKDKDSFQKSATRDVVMAANTKAATARVLEARSSDDLGWGLVDEASPELRTELAVELPEPGVELPELGMELAELGMELPELGVAKQIE